MVNPSPIDREHAKPPERSKPIRVPTALFLGVVCLGVFLVYHTLTGLTATKRASGEIARQVVCASNLRQIGLAIEAYSEANGGAPPPDLQTLFSHSPLTLNAAICPSSADIEPPSSASLSQAGRCSYIYLGSGPTRNVNPDFIVALEDPANHEFRGANVFFADGHVEFVGLPTLMQDLNDLAAGKNPPATRSTFTQATARQDYEKNWKPRMAQLKTGVWRIPTTQLQLEQ